MNRKIKYLAAALALCGSVTAMHAQAAPNNIIIEPYRDRSHLKQIAISQIIVPVRPETDPYLTHYYGVAGSTPWVQGITQDTGSLDPAADPYLLRYYGVASGHTSKES